MKKQRMWAVWHNNGIRHQYDEGQQLLALISRDRSALTPVFDGEELCEVEVRRIVKPKPRRKARRGES